MKIETHPHPPTRTHTHACIRIRTHARTHTQTHTHTHKGLSCTSAFVNCTQNGLYSHVLAGGVDIPQDVLDDVIKVRVDHEGEGFVLGLEHKLVDVEAKAFCIGALTRSKEHAWVAGAHRWWCRDSSGTLHAGLTMCLCAGSTAVQQLCAVVCWHQVTRTHATFILSTGCV